MPIDRTETGFGPGATGASAARPPEPPEFAANGSFSVTVTLADPGNAPEVEYAWRVTADGAAAGYVQADGTVGAVAVWRTLADWGTPLAVTGLTNFVAYTFAGAARNALGAESAWSAESAVMNTLPDIDYGIETRTGEEREVTPGNVRVDPDAGVTISGDTVPEIEETAYYGVVLASYVRQSYTDTVTAAEAEYSEDNGETWAAATSKAGQGDGVTGLPCSAAGTAGVFAWDSYPDAGESEYRIEARLRIRLQDASGDWGAWVASEPFILRNLPGELVFENADARDWDEDATPVFGADMPFLRGGSRGYPEIYVYSKTEGTPLVDGYPKKSVESQAGWEYRTGTGEWTAMTPGGIPDTATELRYTVQTALAAGEYIVTGRMGEVRDRG